MLGNLQFSTSKLPILYLQPPINSTIHALILPGTGLPVPPLLDGATFSATFWGLGGVIQRRK